MNIDDALIDAIKESLNSKVDKVFTKEDLDEILGKFQVLLNVHDFWNKNL